MNNMQFMHSRQCCQNLFADELQPIKCKIMRVILTSFIQIFFAQLCQDHQMLSMIEIFVHIEN